MRVIKRTYNFLFFLGLFILPFNSFKGFPGFGEFSKEPPFLFFVFGSLFFITYVALKGKLRTPIFDPSYQIFLVFLLYCLFNVLLNMNTISTYYFKETTGLVRFIRQYAVLIVSGVFFLNYFYKVFLEYPVVTLFYKMRKIIFYSFIIVCVYSFFEILVVSFGLEQFIPVLKLFNYFPFTEVKLDYTYRRISSVTWEPPYLAIYLITAAGWMFSYILTSKGIIKFLPALAILILAFFSGSRTALVVVFIQLLVFLFALLNTSKYQKYLIYFLAISILGSGLTFVGSKGKVIQSAKEKLETLDFKNNLTKSISNKSRFGIQYANLKVFKGHPIIGVGFGQQAYEARYYYPEWATKDNYEFDHTYLNERVKAFPPGYNLYIRLLAETGLLGFILFLMFLLSIGLQIRGMLKTQTGIIRIIVIVLLVSYVGFMVNWLQVDTFRLFGFWVFLAFLLRVSKDVLRKTGYEGS